MARQDKELWTLVLGKPQVDPGDLAEALGLQASSRDLDYRTRLLIHESINALEAHWGPKRLADWLAACPVREQIETIRREKFDEVGFPSLRERLMEKTDPETVRQLLRELSTHIHNKVRIDIGGSIALIMIDRLSRRTDDIDIVNEVPKEIRSQHNLLESLKKRYGLEIGHFQEHYLPSRWRDRLHYLEGFGNLQVYLVDAYDVFLSKLFGIREKDRDDMRLVAPQLDKEVLVQRLKDTTQSMLASEEFRKRAEQNWYILFGENLPT